MVKRTPNVIILDVQIRKAAGQVTNPHIFPLLAWLALILELGSPLTLLKKLPTVTVQSTALTLRKKPTPTKQSSNSNVNEKKANHLHIFSAYECSSETNHNNNKEKPKPGRSTLLEYLREN
ncbi:hypothetical protein Anapl_01475 [Anas platyrhynchos]|uniref:Uncharacterized protein n=1 Tax=Anas platyrhynchos TaxID=8839 RepID=R0M6Q3_ANAPL|nr:hypothetical protein Anapl_01475 [Anas platyrhynchos]